MEPTGYRFGAERDILWDRPWLPIHGRILRLCRHVVNQRFSLVHNAVSWTSPELVRSIDDAVELFPGNGVLRRGERKRGEDDAERTANPTTRSIGVGGSRAMSTPRATRVGGPVVPAR